MGRMIYCDLEHVCDIWQNDMRVYTYDSRYMIYEIYVIKTIS